MDKVIGLAVACLLSMTAMADQIVLSDDGREVRLNEDGSWEFISEDRYATTEDGNRIRLGADGRWTEVDGEDHWVAVPAAALNISRDKISEGDLNIEVTEMVIESVRSRRQKNTRLSSQIITRLNFSSTEPLRFSLSPAQIQVVDSRGRNYPVETLSTPDVSVSPGEPFPLAFIADGSPRWWGVKFFKITFAPGALGNSEQLELTRSINEITRLEIEALSTL